MPSLTREAAVDYYRRVARWMLPHLKDVPVSFKRYPDEVGGESFWEKDAPSFTPEWVRTFAVPRRDSLAGVKLKSFAKVSGSKGMQLSVPLNGDATHAMTEAFARLVAEAMAKANPTRITAKMGKAYRGRKVFIDYSQNAAYKTT